MGQFGTFLGVGDLDPINPLTVGDGSFGGVIEAEVNLRLVFKSVSSGENRGKYL